MNLSYSGGSIALNTPQKAKNTSLLAPLRIYPFPEI